VEDVGQPRRLGNHRRRSVGPDPPSYISTYSKLGSGAGLAIEDGDRGIV
jgi:hypothetical protein